MNAPTPHKPKRVVPESKRLTRLLVELGGDTVLDEQGVALTRDELLARTLWDLALGGMEESGGEQRFRRPDKQIAMFLMERREGKTPVTVADENDSMVLTEKLDDLSRSRLNSEADALLAVPGNAFGMDGPGDGSEDPEEPDEESGMADSPQ